MAGALYEGKYPLATALGRPLIAKLMVDAAREHGAKAVAHGCTGKGNDQVRFDVTFQTLAPDLKIIAPVREWKMTRHEAIEFAAKHDIPVEATNGKPLLASTRTSGAAACEAGVLEDPWDEPPADAFAWTADPVKAPNEPEYVEIEFEQGMPGRARRREAGRRAADRAAQQARRQARRRPDRPRREPARRHQVARTVRGAGGGHPARGAPRAGDALPEQAGVAVQDAGRPGVRRPHLQWPVVQRVPPGPVRVRGQQSAVRERRKFA